MYRMLIRFKPNKHLVYFYNSCNIISLHSILNLKHIYNYKNIIKYFIIKLNKGGKYNGDNDYKLYR